MDETDLWLDRLSLWVEHGEVPLIPYAGLSDTPLYNPPALHLELVLVIEGEIRGARIGDRRVDFRTGYAYLLNVHRGNYGPPGAGKGDVKSWCLFFDVGEAPEFAALTEECLFCEMEVEGTDRLAEAFARVSEACRLPGSMPPDYLEGVVAFDPLYSERFGPAPRLQLKADLLSLLAELYRERAGRAGGGRQPDGVHRTCDYLAAHYSEPSLTLKGLAEHFQLSSDYLGRSFRRAVGVTPMQY
ncbi:MAG: AraC family transcriptional regulator, partial [Planctomycetota bacterium]